MVRISIKLESTSASLRAAGHSKHLACSTIDRVVPLMEGHLHALPGRSSDNVVTPVALLVKHFGSHEVAHPSIVIE